MTRKTVYLPVCVAAALTLAIAIPVSLAQKQAAQTETQANTHSGEVVSTSNDELTMTIDGKQKHTHKIDADTKITVNGKSAELKDLKKGQKIEVTMGQNNVAVAVKATRQRKVARNESAAVTEREEHPAGNDQQGGEAFLGVALAESSGGGVLIPDVAPNGPAEQAGIRSGDYILSIDNKRVSSPEQLDRLISQMKAGAQTKIRFWRDGQERETTAQLVSLQSFGYRPEGQAQSGAWIGVMLGETDDQQEGVKIERVHEKGPAAQAGLQEGDILVSVNGQKVSDSDAASQAITEMKTGDKATMVVLRDGKRQNVTVTLGDRAEVFGNQSDDSYPDASSGDMPEHFLMLQQHRHFATQHERIEDLCHQMLREIQELRKEVNELKAGRAGAVATPQSN